jgi:hypothetical protein
VFKFGEIAFGDNVRIITAEATRVSGHADMLGVCYGLTTPSVTGVEVIGDPVDDTALNVYFDSDPATPDAWFAPELVALVDHAAGSQATVGDRVFVKGADGEWLDAEVETERSSPRRPRRWFRRT